MASLIRRRYKAKDKKGRVVVKQSPYWYIDYKDADGTRKRIRAFKDKGATAQLARLVLWTNMQSIAVGPSASILQTSRPVC